MSFYYLKFIYIIIPIFLIAAYFLYKNLQHKYNFHQTYFARNFNYQHSQILLVLKYASLLMVILLVSIAMLRPQWGTKKVVGEQSGRDLVFVLDVSKSMKATDLGGDGIDRLTFSKEMIGDFVNNFPENRYGLIIFAGEAFVSTPLTADTEAFLTFLDGVDYSSVSKQGTDLDLALKSSLGRFESKEKNDNGQAIVLISDGGDDISGDFDDAAKMASKLGVKIFTIGIGSEKGTPIPENVDVFGRVSYKKYQGKEVLVKLNEAPLKKIASLTDGKYYNAKNAKDLRKISGDIASLQEKTFKKEEQGQRDDKYAYFVWPAFIFFLAFLFIKPKQTGLITKAKAFFQKFRGVKMFSLFALLFLLNGCSLRDTTFKYFNHQGNLATDKRYIQEAEMEYDKAIDSQSSLAYIGKNNKALLNYQEDKYDEMVSKLKEIADASCDKTKKAYCDQIYYNLGNAYYRAGEKIKATSTHAELWKKAIEAYQKDLEINKDDKEAQENIDFIMKKQAEEQQKNQQSQQNGESKDGQKESEGQKGEGKDGAQGGTEKKDEKGQSAGEKDGEKNPQDSEAGAGQEGQEKQQPLSEQENQALEQYSQQMAEQQKNLQKYFQQNGEPKNNQNDPFGEFANDPMFQQFFGNRNFNNNQNTNEKDW